MEKKRTSGSDMRLQIALRDWAEMNTDKQWARLICNGGLIRIEYGVIHSNGMEECALGSILYMTYTDGKISTMRSHRCG